MSKAITYPYRHPEVWGGMECTINRVHNVFRDQLEDTGHYVRASDIEQFASLGITTIRYPILWERHQTTENTVIDWRWISGQLQLLRDKNIQPIAGLLHHGSGPVFTNLLDKAFPQKLAAYALAVAKQFPWLTYYTPVNEPLTTARFSGLYGIWYPHHKKERSFITMLLNQVKGIVLSMQAVRSVNPDAKLVQTEDLSKTHSTPLLSYQATFENNRRWLTYDLLCGKVNKGHFFWRRALAAGIQAQELNFFLENSCPPSVMGFNYYVTSERYLDQRLAHFPAHTHGGNRRHRYADTEAVRYGRMEGLEQLLKEAWKRYRLPMAITECHLNCTREEQVRWFMECWDVVCNLNIKGIPIKAVTAWSLLGAYDWNSLLTERNQRYESGIFDISEGTLRPTLLAKMISSLAAHGNYEHPVLSQHGWWKQKRDALPSYNEQNAVLLLSNDTDETDDIFVRILSRRNIPYTFMTVHDDNIEIDHYIGKQIQEHNVWAVVYTAQNGLKHFILPVLKRLNERWGADCMIMLTDTITAAVKDNAALLIIQVDQINAEVGDRALDLLMDGAKEKRFIDAAITKPQHFITLEPKLEEYEETIVNDTVSEIG